ncbi:hypothetical protein SISSUDRAFT_1037921, partial [Sistotremastrum suecicum HHB10207 ss-3]
PTGKQDAPRALSVLALTYIRAIVLWYARWAIVLLSQALGTSRLLLAKLTRTRMRDKLVGIVLRAGSSHRIFHRCSIDFPARTEISGTQTKLLRVLNSICAFNLMKSRQKLESLLLEGDSIALGDQHSKKNPGSSASAPLEPPPCITLLLWDRPTNQELCRPAFQGCTDTLRLLSGLPPDHGHSPASWIAHLIVRALLDIRAFDPQVRILNVAFACTEVQACICMAVRGETTLVENRESLRDLMKDELELSWRERNGWVYLTNFCLREKITPFHIEECLRWTNCLSVADLTRSGGTHA